MLSTRRVYPATERWDAKEDSPAEGDETHYGRNKAVSERAVTALLGSEAKILRLSNVFGFEYDPTALRRTFFGQALTSLRNDGQIVLDMDPRSRRDFLPVELCAKAIVLGALQGRGGIYNIGCGFAVSCGQIAQWLLDGYGSGEIVLADKGIRDEFFLNTDKWRAQFGELVESEQLQRICRELGRRLQ
jgi:dTDP-4-dehydrorhamnose reductase/UDP-glucose 4-epimerase